MCLRTPDVINKNSDLTRKPFSYVMHFANAAYYEINDCFPEIPYFKFKKNKISKIFKQYKNNKVLQV